MSRLVGSRMLVVVLATLAFTPQLTAADGGVVARIQSPPSYILVGFAGGFVRHDNPHHGPVRFAQSMRKDLPQGAFLQVFENRHRKTAYQTILRLLDANRDGTLSDDEKSRARIILFGHSWGASAVVMLSRELNRAGIPVLLTVQVDSVHKPWQNDKVIPDNVAAAANFYQPHGMIHGQPAITAADDSKTQILGNYLFDYRKEPANCVGASWLEHVLAPSHMQSECDPRLWTQVENLVRQRMEPSAATVAALPPP